MNILKTLLDMTKLEKFTHFCLVFPENFHTIVYAFIILNVFDYEMFQNGWKCYKISFKGLFWNCWEFFCILKIKLKYSMKLIDHRKTDVI